MAFLRRRLPLVREADPVFRILAVCTGNICRSPQAAQLLRARIPAAFGRSGIDALEVSSAGTGAYDGVPMDPYAALEAERLGITDAALHRARRLDRAIVAGADVVLTMDREHRAEVDRLRTGVHSFTLVEFSLVVEHLASGKAASTLPPLALEGFAAFMRRLVDAAHVERALAPLPRVAVALDIVDPYRRAQDAYRQSADSIDAAVSRLAAALRAVAAGVPAAT